MSPTSALERSGAAQSRIARLGDGGSLHRFAPTPAHTAGPPRLGAAPEFTGTQRWFNTPGGRPLTMASLRGRVVLVDFWTYTCINCIRTLPYLKAWDARYRRAGLTIVGVHSPEFSFEKDAGNVRRAIAADGLRYPVVQDNDLATWTAWGNQAWPAEYLVDATGQVRHVHFGEGDYAGSEAAIRALLAEAGAQRLGRRAKAPDTSTPSFATTPETYVGAARAERFSPAVRPGRHRYAATPPRSLALSHFTLGGSWTVGDQAATAGDGAELAARVHARDVFVVLGPPRGRSGRVAVTVDGAPRRTIVVRNQRLYRLARFEAVQTHVVGLRPSRGTSVYSFTFG